MDFFLVGQMDWRYSSMFEPLKSQYGVDLLKDCPKIRQVYSLIQNTDAYKNYKKYPNPGPISSSILDIFKK